MPVVATKEQRDRFIEKYLDEMKQDGFPNGDAPTGGWLYINWLEDKLSKGENWGKKVTALRQKVEELTTLIREKGHYMETVGDRLLHRCTFCRGYAYVDPVNMKHEPQCPAFLERT